MNEKEKKYPKEYYILEVKLLINKELFEQSIITYEIFSEMQKIIIKKMNLLQNDSKVDNYEYCQS